MTNEEQGAPRPEDGPVHNRSWFTSTVLIVLTLIVAVACVIALACTLTQTRVASIVIDGVGISIPKLDYVGRQWAAQRAENKELLQLEQDEFDAAAKQALANQLVAGSDQAFDAGSKILAYRIEKTFPDLAKTLLAADKPERHGRIMGNKASVLEQDPTLAPLFDDIEAAYNRSQKANGEKFALIIEQARIKTRRELLTKRASQIFNGIKPDLDKDRDARARIENAFYELNIDKFDCGKGNERCGPFGGLVARGLYHILTLRPDLLTLCLVILMGILGSTLQITHAYFMKNEKQNVGGYFQRVAVGAMTALVIFIVAKAGIPVLADTSRLGGDAPINPYLISFLAIISGLLSENAIANIQAQGLRYLGTNGGPRRWLREDSTTALTAQNMTPEALASHLGVDKAVAEAMLKGSMEMDGQQQKIMALSLRDDPRKIFTDIRPSSSAPAAT